MARRFSFLLVTAAFASACTDTRSPAPSVIDAGVVQHGSSIATREDATRVVQQFLRGLESRDRAALGGALASARLADAVDRGASQPLGPERHVAFREALTTELVRDEWRALYQGATVSRVVPGSPKTNTLVVITLDGGAERRAEIAGENSGAPRIVRIY